MANAFSARIAGFAKRAGDAAETIFREATRDVVAEMQRSCDPRPSASHGHISPADRSGGFDPAFLRASLLASTSAMPRINAAAWPVEGRTYGGDDAKIEAAIAAADMKSALYFGYTAAYAAGVEHGTHATPPSRFVALAAQNWQAVVSRKAAEVKNRFGL